MKAYRALSLAAAILALGSQVIRAQLPPPVAIQPHESASAHAVAMDAASEGARSRDNRIHAPYPDTAKGLRQELDDMRQVARKGKSDRLKTIIRELEFPGGRAWYLANFGTSRF